MVEEPTGFRRPPTEPRRHFVPGEMPPLFGDTAATLIVDDDPVVADLLSRILTDEGYQCTTAGSGEEARDRLAESEYALALVDVMMPGESGLELVADMVTRHPCMAVVMVTGVDDPAIAERATESGVYGYIVKPFRPNDVVITVSNASHRRCADIERDAYERHLNRHIHEQTADLEDALLELKRTRRSS